MEHRCPNCGISLDKPIDKCPECGFEQNKNKLHDDVDDVSKSKNELVEQRQKEDREKIKQILDQFFSFKKPKLH